MQSSDISRLALRAAVEVDRSLRSRAFEATPILALADAVLGLDPSQAVASTVLAETVAGFSDEPIKTLEQLRTSLVAAGRYLQSVPALARPAPEDLALCLSFYDALASRSGAEDDALGLAA